MKKLLLITIIALSASYVNAQGISTFVRYSNPQVGYYDITDVAQLNNNKLLFTGANFIMNTDINGNKNWIKRYFIQPQGYGIDFKRLFATNDNGAILLGSPFSNGIFLYRIDSNGTIIWAKKIKRSSSTKAYSFIKTFDNNFIIAGQDSNRSILIKADTLGNIIWSKHNNDNSSQSILTVKELPDHSLIMIGSINTSISPSNLHTASQALIIKTDANANIIWSRKIYYKIPPHPYFFDYNQFISGSDIFYTSDNSFIITVLEGTYGSFSGSYQGLIKLDSLGNIIYATLPFTQANVITVSEYPTGTINIAHLGGIGGDVVYMIYPQLIKTNMSLTNSQATKYISPGAPPYYPGSTFTFSNAKQLSDRRFVFMGYTYSSNGLMDNNKGLSILITDSVGNENCTVQPSPFSFVQDTSITSYPVILNLDTGIIATSVIITDTLIELKKCNCDSLPMANFGYSISGTTVTFTDSSTNATQYYWYLGDNTHDTIANPIHTYLDSINANVTLIAINACGYSSKFVHIVSSPTVGMNDKTKGESILISPNPATNNLNIETPQNATIEIINIQGQIIKTLTTTEDKTQVDVSALAGGVYIIKLNTAEGSVVRKFVKQ